MEERVYEIAALHQNTLICHDSCSYMFWPSPAVFSVWLSPLREVILTVDTRSEISGSLRITSALLLSEVDVWVPLQRFRCRRSGREPRNEHFFTQTNKRLPEGLRFKWFLWTALRKQPRLPQRSFPPPAKASPLISRTIYYRCQPFPFVHLRY